MLYFKTLKFKVLKSSSAHCIKEKLISSVSLLQAPGQSAPLYEDNELLPIGA
jgi:hypothetical protein